MEAKPGSARSTSKIELGSIRLALADRKMSRACFYLDPDTKMAFEDGAVYQEYSPLDTISSAQTYPNVPLRSAKEKLFTHLLDRPVGMRTLFRFGLASMSTYAAFEVISITRYSTDTYRLQLACVGMCRTNMEFVVNDELSVFVDSSGIVTVPAACCYRRASMDGRGKELSLVMNDSQYASRMITEIRIVDRNGIGKASSPVAMRLAGWKSDRESSAPDVRMFVEDMEDKVVEWALSGPSPAGERGIHLRATCIRGARPMEWAPSSAVLPQVRNLPTLKEVANILQVPERFLVPDAKFAVSNKVQDDKRSAVERLNLYPSEAPESDGRPPEGEDGELQWAVAAVLTLRTAPSTPNLLASWNSLRETLLTFVDQRARKIYPALTKQELDATGNKTFYRLAVLPELVRNTENSANAKSVIEGYVSLLWTLALEDKENPYEELLRATDLLERDGVLDTGFARLCKREADRLRMIRVRRPMPTAEPLDIVERVTQLRDTIMNELRRIFRRLLAADQSSVEPEIDGPILRAMLYKSLRNLETVALGGTLEDSAKRRALLREASRVVLDQLMEELPPTNNAVWVRKADWLGPVDYYAKSAPVASEFEARQILVDGLSKLVNQKTANRETLIRTARKLLDGLKPYDPADARSADRSSVCIADITRQRLDATLKAFENLPWLPRDKAFDEFAAFLIGDDVRPPVRPLAYVPGGMPSWAPRPEAVSEAELDARTKLIEAREARRAKEELDRAAREAERRKKQFEAELKDAMLEAQAARQQASYTRSSLENDVGRLRSAEEKLQRLLTQAGMKVDGKEEEQENGRAKPGERKITIE